MRSTGGETQRRYSAGNTGPAARLRVSGSGRWIGFSTAPPGTGEAGDRRGGVAIVDAAAGQRRDFPQVQDFRFVEYGGGEWAVLTGYAAPEAGNESEVTVQRLDAGGSAKPVKIKITGEAVFDAAGTPDRLGWSTRAANV